MYSLCSVTAPRPGGFAIFTSQPPGVRRGLAPRVAVEVRRAGDRVPEREGVEGPARVHVLLAEVDLPLDPRLGERRHGRRPEQHARREYDSHQRGPDL